MQSSVTTAFRALTMLACMVGITALAMYGTSWSEILDKFRNLDWPSMLTPASASTQAENNEAGRFAPFRPTVGPGFCSTPLQAAQAGETPAPQVFFERTPDLPMGFSDIQLRLRELGATYYLLETWGSQRQLYRFYCRMAVGGNVDFTRYFEATDADPLQAMLQVLRQVETLKGGGRKAEGGKQRGE